MAMAIANATAQISDLPAPAIISFVFAETITESEVPIILASAALTLKILASRIEQFESISRRRLSSTVKRALVSDPRSDATPLTLGTSLSSMSATLLARIISNGVVVAGVTTSVRIATSSDIPHLLLVICSSLKILTELCSASLRVWMEMRAALES